VFEQVDKDESSTKGPNMQLNQFQSTVTRSLSILLSVGLFSVAGLACTTSAIEGDQPHAIHENQAQSSHAQPSGNTRVKTATADAHSHESVEYNLGIEQSPVNIPAGMPTHAANIEFHYQPMSLDIVNNGHTVQVNGDGESFFEAEGKKYSLLQFHFHALSEHTYEGEHFDMEVHFVHQSEDGEYAVVGIFLDTGDASTAYGPVFSHMPPHAGEIHRVDGVELNTIDLMTNDGAYYRYEGSFTTPPYTEGVKWFMMSTPVELSADQISKFTELYSHNYRSVQAINERKFIACSSD